MVISKQKEQKIRYKVNSAENQSGTWAAKIEFHDVFLLREISGAVGQNLKILEKNTFVQFISSGNSI